MSFETALSGLNAASADLGVIANNIANTSTSGFKGSRAEFADVYAAANLGTTSTAIGSGVRLAAVAQQFTQGNVSFTDNNLDLAINGQGFFRLNDNGAVVYSRAGAFGIDREGYVVNNSSQRLTAFQADSNGNVTGALGDVRLDTSDIPPNPTATVELGANLDAAATIPLPAFNINDSTSYNNSTSTTMYDSLGTSHLVTMYFVKAGANTWDTHTYVDGNAVNTGTGTGTGGSDRLSFDGTGTLTQINGAAVPPYTVSTASFNPGGGAVNMSMNMSYTGLTQYGSGFSVNSLTQDGFSTGRLTGIDIDESGIIFARYSNGQSTSLGQVAISNFANPQGLRQLGDTTWAETFSSGTALTGAPGSASLGLIQSGALEDSNVDLSEQLVRMITAQRNYQANAQVITTNDRITQTIINIR
jgi:flagellar hook protein FlgE